MKKTKVIIPALGVLLLSTAASVTGTVAWFTSSNAVTASGINVQVEKEEGFVIANESLANWGVSALASHDGKISDTQAAFVPTSTADTSLWAHAKAEFTNKQDALAGTYKALDPQQNGTSGVFDADIGGNVTKHIYLVNNFYIKSSTTSSISADNFYAKVIASGSTNSVNLDKALRVLINLNIDGADKGQKIYAPFRTSAESTTLTYSVASEITADNPATEDVNEYAVTKTSVTAIAGDATAASLASNVTIPANVVADPQVDSFKISVYVYFEGEDAACFSENLTASLDLLGLQINFGTVASI